MARSSTLEERLMEWAREYTGYVREANIGWPGASQMAQIMKYHGRAPQGLNPRGVELNGPADQVELAVRALEAQDKGRIPACILRCEYFASGSAKGVKLDRLRRIGIDVKESGYSQHLRIAKVHVAAWIRVPFDEPMDDDERWQMVETMLGA